MKLLVDSSAGLVYPFFVMRKYSVLNQEGVVETFIQKVGEADHVALDAAITLAGRSGEEVKRTPNPSRARAGARMRITAEDANTSEDLNTTNPIPPRDGVFLCEKKC